MKKIVIVGAGASGLAAGVFAKTDDTSVLIIDHNEKPGKKIYITGKGRCNFTNAIPMEDFYDRVVTNPRFLYSAFARFSNTDLISFVENAGIPVKKERGERMFPLSDHASDITRAFTSCLKEKGVRIETETEFRSLMLLDGRVAGIKTDHGDIRADAVILACGGLSYPSTGSDGSVFPVLRDLGLTVTEQYPSLVPLTVSEDFVNRLEGLSLRNVSLSVYSSKKKKPVFQEFGEMIFTSFGISGPIVLKASAKTVKLLYREKSLSAFIDLKPALSEETLRGRLIRIVEENPNRNFSHFFDSLLPAKMIPVMVELTGIDPGKKLNSVTKQERESIIEKLKKFPLTVNGTGGFRQAVITQGGLSVKEVDPKTMQVKRVPGLYAAGEMLDVDAYTGGFNLQIAFSTGALAGGSAAGC